MDHQPAGLYRLLERPLFYESVQRLFGAEGARRRFVAEMLRPWPGASLLDIGCGTASLLDELPPDVRYTGFDVNPRNIQAARKSYGERGTFLVARADEDLDRWEAGAFDLVVAKAVVHHLDDREAKAMLDGALRLVQDSGVFIAIDPVLHEGQKAISRLLVSLDRGRHVRSPERYRELVETRFEILEARLVTDLLSLPYSHYFIRAAPRK